MRILAIEDDLLFANDLEFFAEELDYTIQIVDNAKDFFLVIAEFEPDVILLDIKIKGNMNGLEVAEKTALLYKNLPIIFVTSFDDRDIFEKAKKVEPFAYIIKPFDAKILQNAIELAFYKNQNIIQRESDFQGWHQDMLVKNNIFFKVNNALHKIILQDIIYLEASDKYVNVITKFKEYLVRITLQELSLKLPEQVFVRIHRSYIININFLETIYPKDNEVQIMGKRLSYTEKYSEELLKKLNLIG